MQSASDGVRKSDALIEAQSQLAAVKKQNAETKHARECAVRGLNDKVYKLKNEIGRLKENEAAKAARAAPLATYTISSVQHTFIKTLTGTYTHGELEARYAEFNGKVPRGRIRNDVLGNIGIKVKRDTTDAGHANVTFVPSGKENPLANALLANRNNELIKAMRALDLCNLTSKEKFTKAYIQSFGVRQVTY